MRSVRRKVQQEFTGLSRTYARLALQRAQREARQFVAWIEPQSHESALDAACGPSNLGRALTPHVERVCGLDVSPEMLERARGSDAHSNRPLLLAAGDVERLPYRSGSFHLLTCTYAFANFRAPLAVLREFARVTRRGGRIALIDVIAPEDAARRERLNCLESARGHLYTRLLTRSEFLGMFAQSGLQVVTARSRRRLCHFREWIRLSPAAVHHPVHARRLRRMLIDSIEGDKAGLHPRRAQGDIIFYHTTAWFLLCHDSA